MLHSPGEMSLGSKGRGKGALKSFSSTGINIPQPGSRSMGTGLPGSADPVGVRGGDESANDGKVGGGSRRTMVGRITEILDVGTFWTQIGTGELSLAVDYKAICRVTSLATPLR